MKVVLRLDFNLLNKGENMQTILRLLRDHFVKQVINS